MLAAAERLEQRAARSGHRAEAREGVRGAGQRVRERRERGLGVEQRRVHEGGERDAPLAQQLLEDHGPVKAEELVVAQQQQRGRALGGGWQLLEARHEVAALG